MWPKGQKRTEEEKEKVSDGIKRLYSLGHPTMGFQKGYIPISKGKKVSEERRQDIIKSLTGHQTSEETKMKISNSLMGHSVSKEAREKISKAGIGRPSPRKGKVCTEGMKKKLAMYCGPLASNWRGGIQAEPYCDIWVDREYKQSILERDNYQCQNPDCSKKSQRLGIHHIDYDKKNCHPWNLITLCYSCNSKANFNRSYWEMMYKKMLEKWA